MGTRPTIPTLNTEMQLGDIASECLTWMATGKGRSGTTVAYYRRIFDQFRAHLRSQGLADTPKNFNEDTVQSFMHDLAARKVDPNTIIVKLAALSTLAKYAMRKKDRGRRVIEVNPTTLVDRPKYVKKETKFPYPNEIVRIRSVKLEPGERMALDLFIDTLVRSTELADANVGDVVPFGDDWYLVRPVKGSQQQRRTFPISAAQAIRLRDYLLARGAIHRDQPLVLDNQARRFTNRTMAALFSKIGRRAGITRLSLSPHKIRHMMNVVNLELAKLDPKTRSSLLGHSRMESLGVYDHLLPGSLMRAREMQVEAFDKYLAMGHEPSPLELSPRADNQPMPLITER